MPVNYPIYLLNLIRGEETPKDLIESSNIYKSDLGYSKLYNFIINDILRGRK